MGSWMTRKGGPFVWASLPGVLVVLMASGCGGSSKPTMTAPQPPPANAVECDKPGTCEPPASLIAAAKKEGEVVMYSDIADATMTQLNDAMQQKYGVKITFTAVTQSDATQRVRQEFESKNYKADIVPLGDVETFHDWLGDGMLTTLSEAEIPNLAALDADHLKESAFIMWGGPAYTLAWNTSKLPAGGAPRSYCDLADPKWKGNFGMVYMPGTTVSVHYHLIETICGTDIFSKFKQNGVKLYSGTTLATQALAAGEFGAFIGAIPYILDPLVRKGAPIEYRLQKEGITISTRWSAMLKGAPHPNAAKLFLNFLLSKEGQEIAFGKNFGVSVLPKDLVPDALIPPGKVAYATVTESNKYWPDIAKQLGQQI